MRTIGSWLSREQRRLLAAAARGVLVSPWLAVGAGVVLAAGAASYAPHARLQFGSAIRVTMCRQSGCRSSPRAGTPAAEPAGVSGTRASPPQAPQAPQAPPPPPAGPTVSYDMLWHDRLGFGMLITVRRAAPAAPWQLKFAIPGADHLSVTGASWQPDGPAGGTAAGRHGTQFVVRGTGRPAPPARCEYNGTHCRFVGG